MKVSDRVPVQHQEVAKPGLGDFMWNPIARAKHSRAGLPYGSDLTDAEWVLIKPFLPAPPERGRGGAQSSGPWSPWPIGLLGKQMGDPGDEAGRQPRTCGAWQTRKRRFPRPHRDADVCGQLP